MSEGATDINHSLQSSLASRQYVENLTDVAKGNHVAAHIQKEVGEGNGRGMWR